MKYAQLKLIFLLSEIKFTQYFIIRALSGDQIMLSKNDFGHRENHFKKPELIDGELKQDFTLPAIKTIIPSRFPGSILELPESHF